MTNLYCNADFERQTDAGSGDNRNGATVSESPSEHTSESASGNALDDRQSTVSHSSGAHDGDDMSLSSHFSCSGGPPTPRDSDANLMADDNNKNGGLHIVMKGPPNARRKRGSSPNLRRRPMSIETDTRRPASSQN